MKGVMVEQQNGHTGMPGLLKKTRQLSIYPSISRGRGYAVLLIKEEDIDENENIIIRPAPRTTQLVRNGLFNRFPADVTIADLTDCALLNVFRLLDDVVDLVQCLSVCKRWYRLINSHFNKFSKLPICPYRPRAFKPMETKKLKIFGKAKVTGIETLNQGTERGRFREVIINFGDSNYGNKDIPNYLGRLSELLLPGACLFADIDLNDRILSFINVWQPNVSELRFLRCSFQGVTSAGVESLMQLKRLKNFYIDKCMISTNCSLTDASKLIALCGEFKRLELCFCHSASDVLSLIDNQFLETLAGYWNSKEDIRWLKICNAPLVTAAGVISLVGHYFKLKSPRCFDRDETKSFGKTPSLVLWLCDTGFDVNTFMTEQPGRKRFREIPVRSSNKRLLRDFYYGTDVVIWVENNIKG